MSDLVIFEAKGEQVAFDPATTMWSLTAMHQAAGGDPDKAPAQWLGHAQTAEYLAAAIFKCAGEPHLTVPPRPVGGREGRDDLAAWAYQVRQVAEQARLIETRRGRYNGGTWAHWQIAAAYAHYLTPAFYLQWNEWAMAYATGRPAPDAPDLAAIRHRLKEAEGRIAALEQRAATPRRRALMRLPDPAAVADAQIPALPWALAIRVVLARADRAMAPAEVVAALAALGKAEPKRARVSARMWQLAQAGMLARDAWGAYRLIPDGPPDPPDLP